MSLHALAGIYTDFNQAGTARFLGVGHSARYALLRGSTLSAHGLNKSISSARVFGSSACDPTLLLFGSPFSFFDFGDFSGQFHQITNTGSTEDNVNLTGALNNWATSCLLVARNRPTEFRVSFRDIFLDKWKEVIDGELSGGAKRDGDPSLTWEMFPTSVSYLDSDKFYLRIHQKLDIEIDWWPDYEASITYHVRLYPTGGNIRGYVARWAYWIEGGVKADDIEEKLAPAVVAGMDKLNEELGNQLSALDFLNVQDVYFLPGRQLGNPVDGQLTGTTWSDVTIVLDV
jgi:hypothetical protein